MKKHICLLILKSFIFFYFLTITLYSIQINKISLFSIILNYIKHYENISSCTPTKLIKSEVIFYNFSSNHYEYRYELNKRNTSSNESRLILLLTGRGRACIDWWDFSVGKTILSQMRSSGFSILAICTSRKDYQITMPIQKNLDIYGIYITLQIWIKEIYYKYFQHYPRLYLLGISQGSRMCSLLCRVLPIQAQILYISPGYRPALTIPSDHSTAMQNRLSVDIIFSNWFYFDYCSTDNNQCPFYHRDKNYFNPIPPTYFIHLKNDTLFHLSDYTNMITDLRKNALNLGGIFLTYKDAIQLHIASPLNISADYMKENFHQWSCKSSSSHLFYEHFINGSYNERKKRLRTCWCTKTNFLYFKQYPNRTKTWLQTKQDQYNDYIKDIEDFRINFCETVCGNILAKHSMTSHHIENTLNWIIDIDHQRFLYKIKDFLDRPLHLWMYNKSELVYNITYQTSMNSSCGQYYHTNQMYSPEYFLYNYFQYLKESYPLSRHNLLWTNNPLLADYYIIPHDYVCIALDHYRPTLTDAEYRSFHIRLNEEYFLPLLNNIRTQFPYWNMTSGSNHIITFTVGKNMGVIQNNISLDILKDVIQLGFTGFRQDLLPHSLYLHRNVKPIYRHNYDIIIPPFNRLQWVNDKPLRIKYEMKKTLLFFAGTINKSNSFASVRRHLALLMKEDIGQGKKYENKTIINEKQLTTMIFNNGIISSVDYIQSIRSSIFHLCPEGFSPWSPRLYESICLGAIPLILAESIVLPFERFINWRSFSTKINVNNVRNLIDLIRKIDQFEDYVNEKLKNATEYFYAFRWPYSSINHNYNRHVFLPEEDMNEKVRNIFHYLSLELRCRRLEQFYGLISDSFSRKSIHARQEACREHSVVCPCYEEEKSLALEEYI